MPGDLSKKQNRVSGLFVQSSGDKKTFKADKGITTPASHVASAEVGKASAKAAVKVFESARWHITVHLNDSHC